MIPTTFVAPSSALWPVIYWNLRLGRRLAEVAGGKACSDRGYFHALVAMGLKLRNNEDELFDNLHFYRTQSAVGDLLQQIS